MLQGTGSDVGKSLLAAGLARAYTRAGLAVRPFKPQNMSNNAAATDDGGEIGRAQALQARAARVAPSVHMNPVLLKPQGARMAQVIVQGQLAATISAADYTAMKASLMPRVLESFTRVASGADLVIVEGAGSPAEINLREGDIANMGFAEAADLPVVLVGDVDRGGVIASIVGTMAVLPGVERARLRGFIINKFRGDPALFAGARDEIARRAPLADLGLVPWFEAARQLPAEDSVGLAARYGARPSGTKIAVPRLPWIANFDDLDPLAAEPDVTLDLVEPGRALPGDAALILLPGSKATIADLAALRAQGWDIDIAAHVRRGGHVLGLCGGYQMLGRFIHDPDGREGPAGSVAGLGLLEVETVLTGDKTVRACTGTAEGETVAGYEIHLGRTEGADRARPFVTLAGRPDGATSADGRIAGCYLHGLFQSDGFRGAFLRRIGATPAGLDFAARIEAVLDALADHLAAHLDLDRLLAIARSRAKSAASAATAA